MYDDVLVAVLGNPEKEAGMFTVDERVRLVALATAHLPNVGCRAYNGLTGTLARDHNASAIIRSAHKEADMERFLAVLNKFMSGGVPTEFAPPNATVESVSSTAIRELLTNGDMGAAAAMVPESIRSELVTAERIRTEGRPTTPPSRQASGPMTIGRRVRPAKIVAVQDGPVLLDRDATLDRTLGLVEKAAGEGADIVVLPESFIPGYPAWTAQIVPGEAAAGTLYGTLFDGAVIVGSAVTQVLAVAAQRFGIYLSVGLTEREPTGSTLYSSQLLFAPDRELLSVHRKSVLNGPEKLVWGAGDGSSIDVVETPFGRIGTLIGWESYMPLLRAEMYAQGVDIYLAPGWDYPEPWASTFRHIAREAGVFVVGTAQCLARSEIPADLPGHDGMGPGHDGWLAGGGTVVAGPSGAVAAGPLEGRPGMVTVDVDVNEARHSRQHFGEWVGLP